VPVIMGERDLVRVRTLAQPTSRNASSSGPPAVLAATGASTAGDADGTAVGGGSDGESDTVRVAPMPR
jgi:Tfp pilus assembly protein PilW